MGRDKSLGVLAVDQKTVKDDWQLLLNEVGCPISTKTDSTAQTTDFEVTASSFFNYKFTTAVNAVRFKRFQQQAGPYISSDNDTILLGLDDKTATGVSQPLSKVLQAFTGSSAVDDSGLISTILETLKDDAVLELQVAETRNALWCVPGQTPTVCTALVFKFSSDQGKLTAVLKNISDEYGIDMAGFPPLKFHLQRTSTAIKTVGSDNKTSFVVDHTFQLTISTTWNGLNFSISLDGNGVSASISQSPDDSTSFWDRISSFKGGDGAPPKSNSKPSGNGIGDSIDLLSVTAAKYSGAKLWWKIQSVLTWDTSSSTTPKPIVIGLSYDSRWKMFSGRLLTKSAFQTDQRSPFFLPGTDVLPRSFQISNLPEVLKLSDIFPEAASLPRSIPDAISAAEISYSSQATGSNLSLMVALVRSDAQSDNDHVPTPFTWDSFRLSASKAKVGSSGSVTSIFNCSIAASFTLHPRPADVQKYGTASLSLQLSYLSGVWQVAGNLHNLQCGLLISFFDADVQNEMVDIVGKLTVADLNVVYTYSQKLASSFLMTGIITLGKLELRLFYQYTSSVAPAQAAADIGRKTGDPPALPRPTTGSQWAFDCFIGSASGNKTTLGEIIDSIVDNGSSNLPDFISGIEINPASDSQSAVSLKVRKLSVDSPGSVNTQSQAAVFVLNVNVLGVKFKFVQFSVNQRTRRIIRLAVDKIPLVSSIPLINQLPQPFDELEYMWVIGDDDLTKADVKIINGVLDPRQPLRFKESTKPPKPDDDAKAMVILHGHHFMVINDGKVALDHCFGVSAADKETGGSVKTQGMSGGGSTDTQASTNEPTKGALTKTLGPLSITAVTLQYKNRVLWIHMDATIALGPMALGLLGFGIGLDTTGLKLNNLKDVWSELSSSGMPKRLHFDLHGLSLAFDRPPLALAGMFEHDIVPISGGTAEVYKGGVGVSFPPYTFVGVGEYAIVEQNGQSYKSVFVFAKLDGPLVTLEFATISGVRLGFGFNSVVRSPAISELTSFPFIKNSGSDEAGNNPMKILQAMEPLWITPKLDSYWFAAGMTITAFDLVSITAVAMFAFRDAGVVISIFANAVAKMPPVEQSTGALLLYVEIGLVAELNLIDGYFRVEASLAPTSFLLVPQCHLTGGFALAYWFGNNPNAGDWVFSIGGYHRAFNPPAYYPRPDRVGISFQIGDNIQMVGQSYFAITPKVVMAGALIHVSLSVGPVSAYLDATFDALINFHPLYYVVEFSISVGVECDIDIWFIHIHISIHLGADLHIEGPPFRGLAHVNFWFFGFDVHFGPDPPPLPALDLLAFWNTTHAPGPVSSGPADADANPLKAALLWNPLAADTKSVAKQQQPAAGAAFKFLLEDGNVPQPTPPTPADDLKPNAKPQPKPVPSTGAGASWTVKGGSFKFGITTEFALSNATVTGTALEGEKSVQLPAKDSPAEVVFSRPMKVNVPIESTLTVTIEEIVGDNRVVIGGWREVAFIKKKTPAALWARYDSNLDILKLNPRDRPPGDLLGGDGATVSSAMGISLLTPEPHLSMSLIPKFKASEFQKMEIPDTRTTPFSPWRIPAFEPEQRKLLAANRTDAEKKMDLPQRWEATQKVWSGLNPAQPAGADSKDQFLMFAATDVFEWNLKRPQEEVSVVAPTTATSGANIDDRLMAAATLAAKSNPPWQLSDKLPKKLINGLKDTYLALPRLCTTT